MLNHLDVGIEIDSVTHMAEIVGADEKRLAKLNAKRFLWCMRGA